jgi:hypothetical protein
MQQLIKTLFVLALFATAFYACKQEDAAPDEQNLVSAEALAQIKKLGFSTHNVVKEEGGYVVEGDIFLSDQDVQEAYFEEALLLRIAETEQYRTTNLVSVSGSTRTLRIGMLSSLNSNYSTALNTAISRYNNENLRLRFLRVTQYPVDILFKPAPAGAGYLASAGFPSGGNPYGEVLMNTSALGSNPGTSYLATIMAHEMGHCIGFRHTDYMDRSYSCGGSYSNEGSGGVGAILIPGTPSGPDAGSWMLACIGSGQNRPFNTNDRTALNYLY